MDTKALPLIPFEKAAQTNQRLEQTFVVPVNHDLLDLVLDDEITVELTLQFFRVPKSGVSGKMTTSVQLTCQRSSEVFTQPLESEFKLYLKTDDDDEALTLDSEGKLSVQALIEEEILLALPLVAIKPGTDNFLKKYSNDEAATSPLSALKDLVN